MVQWGLIGFVETHDQPGERRGMSPVFISMLNLILQRLVHMFIYVGAVLTTLGKKLPRLPRCHCLRSRRGSIGPFRFVC